MSFRACWKFSSDGSWFPSCIWAMRNAEVSFCQTAPFPGLSKMLQRPLGVVARDRVFTYAAIDAGQCRIDRTKIMFSPPSENSFNAPFRMEIALG